MLVFVLKRLKVCFTYLKIVINLIQYMIFLKIDINLFKVVKF